MREHRLRRVEEAFATLPERYLGAEEDYRATVQVRLADVGRSWEVELHPRPLQGAHLSQPACRTSSSAPTAAPGWPSARGGCPGLDAFSQRRLWARGDLDRPSASRACSAFPTTAPRCCGCTTSGSSGARISSLTAGTGPEHVILIHGLGGAKSSFYETVAALTPEYTVHAIDLPGFGSSSKPLRARYDAEFFARHVLRFMDTLAIDRAHLVGNSMGGRVSLEVGPAGAEPGPHPGAAGAIARLAFRGAASGRRSSRLLRPELAALPHALSSGQVRSALLDR